METWVLVLMLWFNREKVIATIPGYSSAKECSEAAWEWNKSQRHATSICIPGPRSST